jgi:hypothetical protein
MSTGLKDCITTLPITPISNPNIGLMVLPFTMDVLGRKIGIDKILSLNVIGAKLYGNQIEECFSGYLSSCGNLDIHPDFVWRDDQGENIFWINKFFHQLKKDGYIVNEYVDIIKCSCGDVESLSMAENFSPSRRLYRNKGDKKYCNLCDSEIKNIKEQVYLFCFPSFGKIKVFPGFYSKELSAMVNKFTGLKFLISRSRPSALALWTGEEKIFLDVDFIWQMFLLLLRRYGYNPKFLVGSTKNLMACCFAATMLNLIDKKEIDIIIPPYYLALGRKVLKGEDYLLFNLLGKYNAKTIRLLLATAMNWGGKESVLDIGLGDLISKMVYRINSTEEKVDDINGVVKDFNGVNIKKILSAVRKKREVFYFKELFGVI